jgi:CheY-like chemotaxis protein
MATLVVVDDESLVTDFLTFLLEGEGYAVHAASNGKEALELINRVRPALVVTDLMMPVMSGLELAGALRRSSDFGRLPIVLCSAVMDPVAPQERLLFTAVFRKPYAPAMLVALIAEHTGATAAAKDGGMADDNRR